MSSFWRIFLPVFMAIQVSELFKSAGDLAARVVIHYIK